MRKWTLLMVLVLSGVAAGQVTPFDRFAYPGDSNPVWVKDSRIVLSHSQVTAGGRLTAAMEIELVTGWVYYSPDPGPSALAGGFHTDTGTLIAGAALWPADKPHTTQLTPGEAIVNNVYEGKFVVYVPLTIPAGTPNGQYIISLSPTGQACGPIKGATQCISLNGPNALARTATVTVGSENMANPQWQGALADGAAVAMTAEQLAQRHGSGTGATGGANYALWAGLGLALLAGLILNIMPCVLPVIPLKVLGIVEMARHNGGNARRSFITLGLAFAGGILLFFAGLVAVNVAMHLLINRGLHWGEHFSSTGFRIAMTLVVAAVAANMWGLFNIALPGTEESVGPVGRGRHMSAMGSGLLAAVLSTPCSFGILTSAIAWAQAQPLWLGSAVLVTIGLGMAIPYLLLIVFPQLVKWLPRPGAWMEKFKKSMGFVMLLVALWLISTIGNNAYPMWVTAYAAVLVFCLWVWSEWVRYDATFTRKLLVRGTAVVLALAAGWWMLTPPEPLAVRFVPFNEAELTATRQAGRPVLVDFTASWCLTCKTVEYRVYNDRSVADELLKRNVLPMKGDVSTRDLPANDMLYKKLGETSVPVSVLFPPDGGKPIRLYGVFSKADLMKALEILPDTASTTQRADSRN